MDERAEVDRLIRRGDRAAIDAKIRELAYRVNVANMLLAAEQALRDGESAPR